LDDDVWVCVQDFILLCTASAMNWKSYPKEIATIAAAQGTDFTSLISCIFISSFVACALGNAAMAGHRVTDGI